MSPTRSYRYWRWRMFLGMYAGYVIYYFTRKNLAPVLPLFSKELGISLMDLGILGSIFYVTYGVGKFISGLLADRSSIRLFMPAGLALASITNILFSTTETLWLLALLWGLNGAFQSMGFPPVAKGLTSWFSASERATKWTLWSSSHTAGTFLIGILAAALMQHYGWRSAFLVPGVLGLITAVLLFFTLRDRPQSIGMPSIETYRNDPAPVQVPAHLTHWQILRRYVFGNSSIWLLCLAYIFVYLIRFGTLDWSTKFLYDVRGIEPVRVALIWSLMPLFGMPGGIVAGWIADRFFHGRCVPITIIYLVLLAASILGFYRFAGPQNIALTCVFLAAIGFFVDGPQNLVGGVQVSRITAPQAVSAACGLTGLFGYIGAMLSGVGLAAITDAAGWAAMFGTCIISCGIAALLVSLTWRAERTQQREQSAEPTRLEPAIAESGI